MLSVLTMEGLWLSRQRRKPVTSVHKRGRGSRQAGVTEVAAAEWRAGHDEREWWVGSAEARIQCRGQRSISDMEDEGSGARKREATGPENALERHWASWPLPRSSGTGRLEALRPRSQVRTHEMG